MHERVAACRLHGAYWFRMVGEPAETDTRRNLTGALTEKGWAGWASASSRRSIGGVAEHGTADEKRCRGRLAMRLHGAARKGVRYGAASAGYCGNGVVLRSGTLATNAAAEGAPWLIDGDRVGPSVSGLRQES